MGKCHTMKRRFDLSKNFSRNFIWRRITGDITIEFLEAAVERMFTADEVSSVVDLAKLKELKHRIVYLFLYAKDWTKALELINS